MKTRQHTIIALFVTALLLAACGGGGGGGGDGEPGDGGDGGGGGSSLPLSDLQGAWYGTVEDALGGLHTFSFEIDADGSMAGFTLDGAVQQSLTGQLGPGSGRVFTLVLSDGTEGSLAPDANGNHAAYLDDTAWFGVVEKNATELPVYTWIDVVGDWTGYGVTLDENYEIDAEFDSSATVSEDVDAHPLSVNDSLVGNSTGLITAWDWDFGAYSGGYTNDTGDGDFRALLSADRQFAASWACSDLTLYPTTCSFAVWSKQQP